MAEYGTMEETKTGCFTWSIDDVMSLKCARSPVFEFRNTPLHLRLSIHKTDDRLELSIHTRIIPRERFEVNFEMNTSTNGETETRCGTLDMKGNFYVRNWMPWTEMLDRRLEILSDGSLTVVCTLTKGENIFSASKLPTLSKEIVLEDADPTENSDEDDTLTLPKYFRQFQKAMKSLLTSGSNSDVTIRVQGKEFPVHKCILGIRSPVFQSMFKHENNAKEEKIAKREINGKQEMNAKQETELKQKMEVKQKLGVSTKSDHSEDSDSSDDSDQETSPRLFVQVTSNQETQKRAEFVDIDNCDPETFQDFLTHLYTGSTSHVCSKNVFALYSVSIKFGLDELKEACVSFMALNFTCETFCTTMSLALQHDEKELVSSASDFFSAFAQKIIDTKEWQKFLSEYPRAGNELFRVALMKKVPT